MLEHRERLALSQDPARDLDISGAALGALNSMNKRISVDAQSYLLALAVLVFATAVILVLQQ
jgi:hypothetical protein